jgi:hypothetical protein
MVVWFPLDAAWIAVLCFIQAAQSHRSQLSDEAGADQLVLEYGTPTPTLRR